MNDQDKSTEKNEYIIVKESSIHNKGVFAKILIPKGTRILQYVGEKVTHEEGEKRSEKSTTNSGLVYIFELNETHSIDGDVSYNAAKYVNHSCNPNCEVDIINDQIWYIALRDILPEEELYLDYNYSFEPEFWKHPCRCGSKNCRGYIIDEDDMPKVKEALESGAYFTKF